MGKNTPDRQQHIIKNLRVEVDIMEEALTVEAVLPSEDEIATEHA
jgi:topoisomerase-4 subunit B